MGRWAALAAGSAAGGACVGAGAGAGAAASSAALLRPVQIQMYTCNDLLVSRLFKRRRYVHSESASAWRMSAVKAVLPTASWLVASAVSNAQTLV